MMSSMKVLPGWKRGLDPHESFKLLIECVRHQKYVPFAIKCWEYLGPTAVEYLVPQVCDPRKSASHRARLVAMIGVTRGSLTIEQTMMLINHRSCKCKTVRDAVIKLFVKLEAAGNTFGGNEPGWQSH